MKTYCFLIYILISISSFYGCRNPGAGHEEKHTSDDGHDHENETTEKYHSADGIIFTENMARAADLKTETVRVSKFAAVIRVGGQIIYPQGEEYIVSANSSGVLSFGPRQLTEGKKLNKGETLFYISSASIQDGDQTIKTRLNYESALKEYKRAQDLVTDLIISIREFEQIKLKYETAKADYETLKNNVTPNGIKVTSPANGYLMRILVNQGAYVTTGQAIASISKNNKLLLRAEVPEKYYGRLKDITTANFKMSYSDHIYQIRQLNGKLLSFGKGAGENSFYIPVTFEFDNTEGIIAGSYAEVYLIAGSDSELISVPVSAITEEQGLNFVYIKTGGDEYMKKEVTTGESNGERIVITKGLTPGEEIVTNGVYQLRLAANSNVIPEGHSH